MIFNERILGGEMWKKIYPYTQNDSKLKLSSNRLIQEQKTREKIRYNPIVNRLPGFDEKSQN